MCNFSGRIRNSVVFKYLSVCISFFKVRAPKMKTQITSPKLMYKAVTLNNETLVTFVRDQWQLSEGLG